MVTEAQVTAEVAEELGGRLAARAAAAGLEIDMERVTTDALGELRGAALDTPDLGDSGGPGDLRDPGDRGSSLEGPEDGLAEDGVDSLAQVAPCHTRPFDRAQTAT